MGISVFRDGKFFAFFADATFDTVRDLVRDGYLEFKDDFESGKFTYELADEHPPVQPPAPDPAMLERQEFGLVRAEIIRLLPRLLFAYENRLRQLEGKPKMTKAQFLMVLKNMAS